MLCGSEVWVVNRRDENCNQAAEMKFEGAIKGCILQVHISNVHIKREFKGFPVNGKLWEYQQK